MEPTNLPTTRCPLPSSVDHPPRLCITDVPSNKTKEVVRMIELLVPETATFENIFLGKSAMSEEEIEEVYWELSFRGIGTRGCGGCENIPIAAGILCPACREEHDVNSSQCYEMKVGKSRELVDPDLLKSLHQYLTKNNHLTAPEFSINLSEKLNEIQFDNLQRVMSDIKNSTVLKLQLLLHHYHDHYDEIPSRVLMELKDAPCKITKFRGCIGSANGDFLPVLRDKTSSESHTEISFIEADDCKPRYLLGISGVASEYSHL